VNRNISNTARIRRRSVGVAIATAILAADA